jgi:hypothetical protein
MMRNFLALPGSSGDGEVVEFLIRDYRQIGDSLSTNIRLTAGTFCSIPRRVTGADSKKNHSF